MFEKKNTIPENDPLKEQFDGIDQMVCAPDRLVQAAKNGTPLGEHGIRYTTGIHVRKFAKAAMLYVVGISLFLGFLLLLPGLFEGSSLVGGTVDSSERETVDSQTASTTPVLTGAQDMLTISGLTEEERAIYDYVWCVVRDTPQARGHTINDLKFGLFKKQYGDVYVCYFNYDDCFRDAVFTGPNTVYSETIAGYEFRYGKSYGLSVFADYTQYDLQDAYSKGVLTEADVRTIWEDYKAMHPCYYVILPDGMIPTPEGS